MARNTLRGRFRVKKQEKLLTFSRYRSELLSQIYMINLFDLFGRGFFLQLSLLSVAKASRVYLRPSQYTEKLSLRCKQFISVVRFSPFRSDEEGKTIISIPGIQHISNTFWRFSAARHRSIYRSDLLSLSRICYRTERFSSNFPECFSFFLFTRCGKKVSTKFLHFCHEISSFP